jgi:type I restriction enzyme S subunit
MAEWTTCKLGEVVNLKRGYDLPQAKRSPGPYPIISSSGITDYHSEAKVKGPGVVTGRYGTLGHVFYVESDFWPLNTSLYVQDFKGSDRRFISYFLQRLNFGTKNAAGAVPGVNRNHLHAMEVCVPFLPVQRRIAGILSAYDELIENSQRRIRILEEMARALYREWFVHFRFPGHERHPRIASRLGALPKGWEAMHFTEIANVLSGGTPKTGVPEYWNGGIPFFTPRDARDCFYVQDTDKHVSELGLSTCASELYLPDTVFITARGTVGKVALPSVPMAMNQSCYALRGKPGIPQRFLFLMTLQQVDYLKTNTGGATFDTIVVDTFRRMEVVKPTRDIVALFAKGTDPIFEQVNTLQRQIQNLRHARDLLLPRLLSGLIKLPE